MRGSLMRTWTKEQHAVILTKYQDDTEAAVEYTRQAPQGRTVARQNVAYWRKIFLVNDGNLPATDRAIRNSRTLKKQTVEDTAQLPDLHKVYNCILVIPDQHAPYTHPDAIPFLAAVAKQFPIDLVVNLGDETDFHALSFHDSDPDLDSAGTELEKAKVQLERLYQLFPNQLVCDSNHGSMVYRKAKHTGIPVAAIKSYREILFPEHKAPGWNWAESWSIRTPAGNVLFKHQASSAITEAAHERTNLVVGHNHGKFDIEYAASKEVLYWACTSGCLIDNTSLAFAYGKHSLKKPIIGCTVILRGIPHLIPMRLSKKGRWVGYL